MADKRGDFVPGVKLPNKKKTSQQQQQQQQGASNPQTPPTKARAEVELEKLDRKYLGEGSGSNW